MLKEENVFLKKQSRLNWWVKSKKSCTTLNYIEHFLILASSITGCIPISSFPSLIGFAIGTTSSAKGLSTCAITAGIKTYKSIIKKINWSMIK